MGGSFDHGSFDVWHQGVPRVIDPSEICIADVNYSQTRGYPAVSCCLVLPFWSSDSGISDGQISPSIITCVAKISHLMLHHGGHPSFMRLYWSRSQASQPLLQDHLASALTYSMNGGEVGFILLSALIAGVVPGVKYFAPIRPIANRAIGEWPVAPRSVSDPCGGGEICCAHCLLLSAGRQVPTCDGSYCIGES